MFENTQRIAGLYGRSLVRDPNERTLGLSAYANQLPDPEPAFSNLAIMQDRVGSTTNKVLFPIDGNDQYGDCTIAGLAHLITLLAGLTGITVIPSTKDVTALYFHLTGGKDNGLNLSDVTSYLMKNPFSGMQLQASVSVDPKNWQLVQQAIQFFGAVYIGFNTTSNVISNFNQGIPWDGGHLDGGGHCVVVPDYDPNGGGTCFTWGNIQRFTTNWWKQCVDEVKVLITPYNAAFTNSTIPDLISAAQGLSSGSSPSFR